MSEVDRYIDIFRTELEDEDAHIEDALRAAVRVALSSVDPERVIDDFVVARIDTYFDADDARDAFGDDRLSRLEREGRIVVCGDPARDDYYARAPR